MYLPKGTLFKPDSSLENFDSSDDDFFNLHHSGEYNYRVDDTKVKCLNCPEYENEHDDIESEEINIINENDSTNTISIKINGEEVIERKEGKPRLQVNENGIIIKTK